MFFLSSPTSIRRRATGSPHDAGLRMGVVGKGGTGVDGRLQVQTERGMAGGDARECRPDGVRNAEARTRRGGLSSRLTPP